MTTTGCGTSGRAWRSRMTVFMLALLGFPVFGGMGFFAKWYVLQAALQAPRTADAARGLARDHDDDLRRILPDVVRGDVHARTTRGRCHAAESQRAHAVRHLRDGDRADRLWHLS